MNRTEFIGTNLYYSQKFVDDLKENYQQEIERLNNIIKEARELLNQEWYSVLRKGTIIKVREILDKENQDDKN